MYYKCIVILYSLIGFSLILAKDCWHNSLVDLLKSVSEQIEQRQPVYLTFDIDPAFCSGIGKIVVKFTIFNMHNNFLSMVHGMHVVRVHNMRDAVK